MERECLQCGFSEEQTDKLMYGHIINYSGWLCSNEYRRNALADNVSAQVIMDAKRNLFLYINETPIAQWLWSSLDYLKKRLKGREIGFNLFLFLLLVCIFAIFFHFRLESRLNLLFLHTDFVFVRFPRHTAQ